MSTPQRDQGPDLDYAFRVVAGDTPPTDPIPFTDYGHLGPDRIDKRVILQTETWVDRHGTPLPLSEMSPEHRGNVLGFLHREAPGWVIEAYRITVYLAVAGGIEPAQASCEIEALACLPPGWVDHTPLGRELHQLNGTTPPPLPDLAPRVTATDSDTPDLLRDHDTGSWQVTTASRSGYTLDLDHRRIRRNPRPPSNGDTPAKALAGDGEWTDLAALVDCTVTRPLVLLDVRDGQDGFRISTPILTISRTDRVEPVHGATGCAP